MKPHIRFRQGEWAVEGPVFTGTGSTIAAAWRDYLFWLALNQPLMAPPKGALGSIGAMGAARL